MLKKIGVTMKIDVFPAQGLKLITLKSFPDDRGFFCERFKLSQFEEMGLPIKFVQDNFSRSHPNTLRGLHYQWEKPQGKLVTCLSGKILDIVVDIRFGSKTFGSVTRVELSGDLPQWFWVPAGFAHGFYVLGNQQADVLYKCDAEYNPKFESGIRWSDETLNISWPTMKPQVSNRDQVMPSFEDYKKSPVFRGET
jgi:dTDP-4-dehydrorhamnose 3,5-epimerase